MNSPAIISAVPELPPLFKQRRPPGRKQAYVRDPMFDMVDPCRVAVEVGSQWGWWPRRAARCLPDAKIYSVDLFPYTDYAKFSSTFYESNIWEWAVNVEPWLGKHVFGLWGDSVYWASKFREEVTDQPIDLLFIDADHEAESVYKDCKAWVPLVRPGGLICGHDWGGKWGSRVRQGVKKYFGEKTAAIKAERIFYSGRRARLDLGMCWWTRKWSNQKEST